MTEESNLDQLKKNLSQSDHWLRLALVVIYGLIFLIGLWVLGFAVLLNLIIQLITGERNGNLAEFGAKISAYFNHIMTYATLNSDTRPFPFGDWEDSSAVQAASEPSPSAPRVDPVPVAKKTPSKKTAAKKTRKKASKKKAASSDPSP